MFSNITDAWSNDPVKEMTNKLSNAKFSENDNKIVLKNNTSTIPDINSISLASERASERTFVPLYSDFDYSPYAPLEKYSRRTNRPARYEYETDVDEKHNNCMYSIKHLKNCDQCYNRLKKLINDKIDKKFDEIMLDYKLKQIQNATTNTQSTLTTQSGKEILLVVIGIVIALIIIFLIIKAIHK